MRSTWICNFLPSIQGAIADCEQLGGCPPKHYPPLWWNAPPCIHIILTSMQHLNTNCTCSCFLRHPITSAFSCPPVPSKIAWTRASFQSRRSRMHQDHPSPSWKTRPVLCACGTPHLGWTRRSPGRGIDFYLDKPAEDQMPLFQGSLIPWS